MQLIVFQVGPSQTVLLASLGARYEYYSAVTKTTEETKKLSEDGFDYVCTTPEGLMLFRKRK